VEGIRIRGGRHLIQNVSAADVVLRNAARREPLPPTVRRRDYVWEVFAGRGMPVAAINWWTTDGQALVFAAAARGGPFPPQEIARRVDATAARMLVAALDRTKPQCATVYLPALDILLNRLALDESAKLAMSVRTVDALDALVREVRGRGYDVVLIGLPGDRQSGGGVLAWTMPSRPPQVPSAYDVAPTLCDLLGFPATREMPGRSLAAIPELPRVATFGRRAAAGEAANVNDEYYKSLKSLGYIR
jgi:hypothetical protein